MRRADRGDEAAPSGDERGPVVRYEADLHIHTVLSLCAEIEMLPPLIVEAAQRARLDIIAIADHNSCGNAGAVIEAADGTGLKVLPGIEVQSVEGVHILCLFDGLDAARSLQEAVYASLPRIPGAERAYDQQMLVNAEGEFVGYCEAPLSWPTSMEIDEVWERTMDLGGLVIPSHIERSGTGLCSVLGMLPESPEFAGIEITENTTEQDARSRYLSGRACAIFHNSDAHWLSAVGQSRTVLRLRRRTVAEIALACARGGGRSVGDDQVE